MKKSNVYWLPAAALCATKEEAVAIAEACPAAQWATIEVREPGPCYET